MDKETKLGKIKNSYRVRRGISYNHIFCSFCGVELTKLDLKTGKLRHKLHLVHNLTNGIQVKQCIHKTRCSERAENGELRDD